LVIKLRIEVSFKKLSIDPWIFDFGLADKFAIKQLTREQMCEVQVGEQNIYK